jgi:N utilization substance protein A
VREVIVDDEERQATVIVPDDQLSLAIGRDGQNARLAARLTGWRVDIKSETEFASEETEIEYEGEEQSDGRCLAVLSNGRRCPNAAVPGSTYCGLPSHQALARFETSQVAVLAGVSEGEIAVLADPDGDVAQVNEIVARASADFVEDEPEDAPTAGPVADEDSSSSQAAGEEPSSAPPAEGAPEALDDEGPAEVAGDEAVAEAEVPVAEEAEQA